MDTDGQRCKLTVLKGGEKVHVTRRLESVAFAKELMDGFEQDISWVQSGDSWNGVGVKYTAIISPDPIDIEETPAKGDIEWEENGFKVRLWVSSTGDEFKPYWNWSADNPATGERRQGFSPKIRQSMDMITAAIYWDRRITS